MKIEVEISDKEYEMLQKGVPVTITLQNDKAVEQQKEKDESCAAVPIEQESSKGTPKILICMKSFRTSHNSGWVKGELHEATMYEDNTWSFPMKELQNKHSLEEVNDDYKEPLLLDVTDIVLELKEEKVSETREQLEDYLKGLYFDGNISRKKMDDVLDDFDQWCDEKLIPRTDSYFYDGETFDIEIDTDDIYEMLEAEREEYDR